MFERLKRFLLGEDEIEEEKYDRKKYSISLEHIHIHSKEEWEFLGEQILADNIVLLEIDEEYYQGTLDFVDGVCFVNGSNHIQLNDAQYLYLPTTINYTKPE